MVPAINTNESFLSSKQPKSNSEPIDFVKLQVLTNIAAKHPIFKTSNPLTSSSLRFSHRSLSPPARIRRLDLAHRADVIFNETVLRGNYQKLSAENYLGTSPIFPKNQNKFNPKTSLEHRISTENQPPLTRLGSIMSQRKSTNFDKTTDFPSSSLSVGGTSLGNPQFLIIPTIDESLNNISSTKNLHGSNNMINENQQASNDIYYYGKSEEEEEENQNKEHRRGYLTKNKSLRIMQDLDIGDLFFGITEDDMILYHKINNFRKRKRSMELRNGPMDKQESDEYNGEMSRKFHKLRSQIPFPSNRETDQQKMMFFDDGGNFDINGRIELDGITRDLEDAKFAAKRYRHDVEGQKIHSNHRFASPIGSLMEKIATQTTQDKVGDVTNFPAVTNFNKSTPIKSPGNQFSVDSVEPKLSRRKSFKKFLNDAVMSKFGTKKGGNSRNETTVDNSKTSSLPSSNHQVQQTILKSIISGPIVFGPNKDKDNFTNQQDFDSGDMVQPLKNTSGMVNAGGDGLNALQKDIAENKTVIKDDNQYQRSSIISVVPLTSGMGNLGTNQRLNTDIKYQVLLQEGGQSIEPITIDTIQTHKSISTKSFESQEDEDQQFYYTPQATMQSLINVPSSETFLSQQPRSAPLPPPLSKQQLGGPMSEFEQIFIPTLVSNPSLLQSSSTGITESKSEGPGNGMFTNLLKRGGSTLSFKLKNRSKLSPNLTSDKNGSASSIDTRGITNFHESNQRSSTPSRLVQMANAMTSTGSLLQRINTNDSPKVELEQSSTTRIESGPRQVHSIEDTLVIDRDLNDFKIDTPTGETLKNLAILRGSTSSKINDNSKMKEDDIIGNQTISMIASKFKKKQKFLMTQRSISPINRKMSYVLEDPVAESINNFNSYTETPKQAEDVFDFDNTPRDLTFTTFKRRQSSIMMPRDKLKQDLKDLHSNVDPNTPNSSISQSLKYTAAMSQLSPVNQPRIRSTSTSSSMKSGTSLMSKKSKFPKVSTPSTKSCKDSICIPNYKPRSPTLSPKYRRYSGMSHSDLILEGKIGSDMNNPYELRNFTVDPRSTNVGIFQNPYLEQTQYLPITSKNQNDGNMIMQIPRSEINEDDESDLDQEKSNMKERRMGSITDEILKEGFYD